MVRPIMTTLALSRLSARAQMEVRRKWPILRESRKAGAALNDAYLQNGAPSFKLVYKPQ